ncbi:hypothetical protein ACFFGF_03720 [Asaia lannensis]|uniref:Phospholipase D-like domain-containing protein n=1 Tax=Asaia lannensis NBRC 102526 TaxID=1307926 RepID=A0ABT1CHJ4_9PROT|nr:hypothetical protein [Asaia lannensis]MCO6160051.1 hypothetical protein [Asaia lannensis NBRC 102526]GBQ99412.1 hypothetical protein AA102526_1801 [Asaia lannensis NBRC 102526]
MSYAVLNGPELMRQLKQQIEGSDRIDLAVAFWGRGAGEQLGLRAGLSSRLICNLDMGGTNPDEIRTLLALGYEVKCHRNLHAKIGVIGTSFSFLGSSNMSANGLGFEGSDAAGWEESNIAFPVVEAAIADRFSELWLTAEPITGERLSEAEVAWRLRQRIKRAALDRNQSERSFLTVLRKDPQFFDDNSWYVVVTYTLAPEDKLIVDHGNDTVRRLYGDEFEIYWDWNELPKEAIIIDFRKPARGSLVFGGMYRRNPEFPDFVKEEQSFHPAYKLKECVQGIKISSDLKDIKSAVGNYLKYNPNPDKNGVFIRITELVDYFA